VLLDRGCWLGMLQDGSRALVSKLSLDGIGKRKLNIRFQKEIVVEMEKIEVQSLVFDTKPELGHISGYGIKRLEKIVVKKDKI